MVDYIHQVFSLSTIVFCLNFYLVSLDSVMTWSRLQYYHSDILCFHAPVLMLYVICPHCIICLQIIAGKIGPKFTHSSLCA